MTAAPSSPPPSPAALLAWYLQAGVDEAVGEQPVNRYAPPATRSAEPRSAESGSVGAAPPPAPRQPAQAAASSAHLAMDCSSLAELRAALEAYDGCALKRGCQRTVFGDGNPEASVMLIGEAPGADEDRLGLPFVGVSGRLLDRMLASIGLDRNSAYITNVVPWRPPGNRKPEPAEVELCLPFIQRHIELVAPSLLVLLGGAATAALLARQDPISRLRGRWADYSSPRLASPLPAMPTYHPAYLLRTPDHKKEAWRDFLAIRKRLDGKA
ncbi:MAG TPA: uracil-DNA glycosylase [Rhodospirillaceae bacterium]|nr:uracil-DNA glycosylase [Rhodospirillaceae bacterium]